MRLVPDSLAGRILLVLIGGLFTTLVASIAVLLFLDRLIDADATRYPRLIERVASIAETVNSVPAAARPELLAQLSHGRIAPLGAGAGADRPWPPRPAGSPRRAISGRRWPWRATRAPTKLAPKPISPIAGSRCALRS